MDTRMTSLDLLFEYWNKSCHFYFIETLHVKTSANDIAELLFAYPVNMTVQEWFRFELCVTESNIWDCWYRLPKYGTKILHEWYRIYIGHSVLFSVLLSRTDQYRFGAGKH